MLRKKDYAEEFNDILEYFKANKNLWEKNTNSTVVSDDAYFEFIRNLSAIKDHHDIAKLMHDSIKKRGALNIPGPIPEVELFLSGASPKQWDEKTAFNYLQEKSFAVTGNSIMPEYIKHYAKYSAMDVKSPSFNKYSEKYREQQDRSSLKGKLKGWIDSQNKIDPHFKAAYQFLSEKHGESGVLQALHKTLFEGIADEVNKPLRVMKKPNF